MKEYQKMEVFKVAFNAKDQVAAASCELWDAGSKYENTDGTKACTVASGKYAPEQMPIMCMVNGDGVMDMSGVGGGSIEAKYQS